MKNVQSLIDKITSAPKGSFQRVAWKSNPTPAAEHKNKGVQLEKITSAVVKAGIDFSNLAVTKEGIASGERGEVESLPWGEWESFPFIIRHKGEKYVRLYPASQENQIETKFFVNGRQTYKADFASYLTPSEQKKMYSGEKAACFTVKASNLIS